MVAQTPSAKQALLQATAEQLGPKVLETIDPRQSTNLPSNEPPKAMPDIPACITQNSVPQNLANDPASIMIGLKDLIPRWTPGSVINWTAWRTGFALQEDADHAAVMMWFATQKWNATNVGVSFEYVQDARDAQFIVCHGGNKGTVLASAYFPNGNDLNFVYVYSYAFQPDWKNSLWCVFMHELGHVLGLRHEFALDPGDRYEGNAVQLGSRNPLSVMNYRREPPQIQESDILWTTLFYKLRNGTKLFGEASTAGTPIVDFDPK